MFIGYDSFVFLKKLFDLIVERKNILVDFNERINISFFFKLMIDYYEFFVLERNVSKEEYMYFMFILF